MAEMVWSVYICVNNFCSKKLFCARKRETTNKLLGVINQPVAVFLSRAENLPSICCNWPQGTWICGKKWKEPEKKRFGGENDFGILKMIQEKGNTAQNKDKILKVELESEMYTVTQNASKIHWMTQNNLKRSQPKVTGSKGEKKTQLTTWDHTQSISFGFYLSCACINYWN